LPALPDGPVFYQLCGNEGEKIAEEKGIKKYNNIGKGNIE